MQDDDMLDWLRQQSQTAQYVTGVCTGSMILAAAGQKPPVAVPPPSQEWVKIKRLTNKPKE
jgi:putative intracellular protease/amidase